MCLRDVKQTNDKTRGGHPIMLKMAAHQKCCSCHGASCSLHQTLNEIDFERGLWSAALSGQIEDVENRLRKGDDVNARDKSGYTALHYAARNGNLNMCNSLLYHGADINAVTSSGQATPLHRAAYMGHHNLVDILLQHGANPRTIDIDGMTSLHKAAEQGHMDSVRILLRSAPECKEVKDLKGRKPADLAVDLDLKTFLS